VRVSQGKYSGMSSTRARLASECCASALRYLVHPTVQQPRELGTITVVAQVAAAASQFFMGELVDVRA